MRHQLNQKVKQTNCKMKTSSKKPNLFFILHYSLFLPSPVASCCSTPSATKTKTKIARERKRNKSKNSCRKSNKYIYILYIHTYIENNTGKQKRGLLHFRGSESNFRSLNLHFEIKFLTLEKFACFNIARRFSFSFVWPRRSRRALWPCALCVGRVPPQRNYAAALCGPKPATSQRQSHMTPTPTP